MPRGIPMFWVDRMFPKNRTPYSTLWRQKSSNAAFLVSNRSATGHQPPRNLQVSSQKSPEILRYIPEIPEIIPEIPRYHPRNPYRSPEIPEEIPRNHGRNPQKSRKSWMSIPSPRLYRASMTKDILSTNGPCSMALNWADSSPT